MDAAPADTRPDSLLASIQRKLEAEHAGGAAEDKLARTIALPGAAAPPAAALPLAPPAPLPLAPPAPLPAPTIERPLNELVRTIADVYVDAQASAFRAEGLRDAGEHGAGYRKAREQFDGLVAELKQSADTRVARAAAGAPLPEMARDSVKAVSDLLRAKVDMSTVYERGLGDLLQQNLADVKAASEAITTSARERLRAIDELETQWEARAARLTEGVESGAASELRELEAEWDRRVASATSSVPGRLVLDATRSASLVDRIGHFLQLASAATTSGSGAAPAAVAERGATKVALGAQLAETVRYEMRASDERMDHVLLRLDDVERRRREDLGGAAAPALDAEQSILHAEAIALAGSRAQLYKRLRETMSDAGEAATAAKGAAAMAVVGPLQLSAARDLLRRATLAEARQRSGATVRWRLKEAVKEELAHARGSVVDATTRALGELRTQAGAALAERVRALDAQYVEPMQQLARDIAAVERSSGAGALPPVEPWERTLDAELSVVRERILSQIREAIGGAAAPQPPPQPPQA